MHNAAVEDRKKGRKHRANQPNRNGKPLAFVQSVRIMRYLSPFTVVLSISMEPIYGILLALLMFGSSEAMPLLFYGGFAVVLAMLLVNAWMQRRRRAKLSTS